MLHFSPFKSFFHVKFYSKLYDCIYYSLQFQNSIDKFETRPQKQKMGSYFDLAVTVNLPRNTYQRSTEDVGELIQIIKLKQMMYNKKFSRDI